LFELYDTKTNEWSGMMPEYNDNILNTYVNNPPSFVAMFNYSSQVEEV